MSFFITYFSILFFYNNRPMVTIVPYHLLDLLDNIIICVIMRFLQVSGNYDRFLYVLILKWEDNER